MCLMVQELKLRCGTLKKIFDNLQEAERTIHDDNCFTKRVQAVPKLGHVKTSSFELILT